MTPVSTVGNIPCRAATFGSGWVSVAAGVAGLAGIAGVVVETAAAASAALFSASCCASLSSDVIALVGDAVTGEVGFEATGEVALGVPGVGDVVPSFVSAALLSDIACDESVLNKSDVDVAVKDGSESGDAVSTDSELVVVK